ncbi:MAG: hypothetical protein A3C11_00960 [Candidatus Sungbacteria bacterium RIFCSPHIGHO2_02_FULL_49_12]|uniref:Uncharacterized protein n=1 Tax=Candidatus Sungbacteria bacterium RIFCSPHIGHO2_02_FULL_49_12 TaxID=1802271 RepID=A0A1G2KNP2_9BACT|nr:MAG: hypothetical protein A3C11_00960 [Candidatus Sungbacteria bacterium RIFCSPHIGHO2_02_FULL_49_12]
MPKVSQNPLPPAVQKEISDAFVRTLVRIDSDALLQKFLGDLLTPGEKLMLSKRLMAVILLQNGYSCGSVCRMLKMSKATIYLYQRDLLRSGDGYKQIFELFFKESKGKRWLETLSRVLDALTLPVKGSPRSMRRWRSALHKL